MWSYITRILVIAMKVLNSEGVFFLQISAYLLACIMYIHANFETLLIDWKTINFNSFFIEYNNTYACIEPFEMKFKLFICIYLFLIC